MTEKARYSSISTINHWVTALLVVVMIVLGLVAGAAPSKAAGHYILGVHVSLGFFVFLVVIWRVLVRLYEGFPANTGKTAIERRAAWLAHRAILILLVLQVFTGPLYLFTENECLEVFGWFSICLPLGGAPDLHELIEGFHVITGMYILPALLVLHFFGAIRHYVTRNKQGAPADL